ncbi:hypothetical protein ACFQ08_07710 [Streptosporangium algeriense]|uniref:Uncharacterized protein n=1 Tax=Streptosporangium algeriense TaxID=1682748 RepID=A0ABW3DN88_9ACTN
MIVALSAAALLMATGVFVFSRSIFAGYGCTEEIEELLPALESLSVLDAHPDSAEEEGGRRSGCESDDEYVYVRKSYRSPLPPASLTQFYEQAAVADGWTRCSPYLKGVFLFEKPLQKTLMNLSVAFPKNAPKGNEGEYEIEVRVSNENYGKC